MSAQLRTLTSDGIQQFAAYLSLLREDRTLVPPWHLLDHPACSESVPSEIALDRPGFKTKLAAAQYLSDKLASMSGDIFQDAGLWSWLALFYFDDVCPAVDGRRKPVANPHYILEPRNYLRRYRHLLATPVRILRLMPEHNMVFLNAPLPVHGDIVEQTMSRLYLYRQPAIGEAIDLLYLDKATTRAKRGIVNKSARRGDLRNRFITRVSQLMITHDIASMTGIDLVRALGKEFEPWLDGESLDDRGATA
jgi:hypothetical protein